MGSEGRLWSIILPRASHQVEPGRGGREKIGVGEPSADAWTLGRLATWGRIKEQSGGRE